MARSPVSLPSSRVSWKFLAGLVIAVFLLFYLADFTWYELRLRFPKMGQASGSVHRIRLLAIPNKSNKTTFELDMVHPEEDIPCSHSLFPQGGTQPCWYVARHANDPISI